MSEAVQRRCACGRPAASDGRCHACRLAELARARRRYHFTPELRDELRRVYCGRGREITAGLDALCRKTGWPRHAFKLETQRLGLQRLVRREWTEREIAYLREKCCRVSMRAIANKLGRSWESTRAKAEKLRLSRRISEGYCMEDLQVVFGESAHRVRRWLTRGLFGTVHRINGKRVSDRSVQRFLEEHPHEYDLRRIDQAWFKGILFGRK